MRRLFHAAAVLLILLGGARATYGQGAGPSPDEIRRAGDEFDLGKRAFKNDEYAEAAEHFEAADRIAASAKALELAIQSRNKAKQLDRAATLAALAQQRYSENKKLRSAVASILERAENDLHRVVVVCDSPCDVAVGTRLQHGGPLSQRVLYLAPGELEITAGWSEGRTVTKSLTAEESGETTLEFEEPPPPKPKESAPHRRGRSRPRSATPDHGGGSNGWSPAVFWVGTGLTALAAGVTIWSGTDTQNNPGPDTVRDKCAGLGEDCPEYRDGLGRQRRTNVLLGATGALAVATIIIGAGLTDWGSEEEPARPKAVRRSAASGASVEPWMGLGDGVAVGAVGRW